MVHMLAVDKGNCALAGIRNYGKESDAMGTDTVIIAR